MAAPGALAVLFLSIFSALSLHLKLQHIAVSSDVTFGFGPCEPNTVYNLHHGGVTAIFHCGYSPQIPDKFKGRMSFDETSGSVTLRHVTRSDAGYYTLERTNGNGKKETLLREEVRVLDPIWTRELFHNKTGGTISLSVPPGLQYGTITWTVDGRDLPDPSWLSPDNRTLTMPYNYTGTIMASNPVSEDKKSIIIRGLNEKSCPLGLVMYTNITRLIWDDYGGEPRMQTHTIPRNISTICVLLTPSDEAHEPQRNSSKHFGLCPIPVVVILAIIFIFVTWQPNLKKNENLHEDQRTRAKAVTLHLLENGST